MSVGSTVHPAETHSYRPSAADASASRAARIQQLLKKLVLDDPQGLSRQQVLEENPDLAPDLARQLSRLKLVRRAGDMAAAPLRDSPPIGLSQTDIRDRIASQPPTTEVAVRLKAPEIGVVGETSAADHIIRTLLHRRLLFLLSLAATTFGLFLTRGIIRTHIHRSTLDLQWVFRHLLVILACGGLALFLWRHPRAPLLFLRWVELSFLALLVGFFCYTMYFPLEAIARGDESGLGGVGLARMYALPLVPIILGYAIVIPNSTRRCFLVVLAIAAAPAVILLRSCLITTGPAEARTLQTDFAVEMTIWLASAVVMATFSVQRIARLSREANALRRLGQYQLKRRLGAGGMGEVYLAEHLLLRRSCAIKLIRMERANDAEYIARFEREVRATCELQSFNTVQIFDYGRTEDGLLYYVMEYLPGENLQQLVSRSGPLPTMRVIGFLRQLCRSLHEAHSAGLVHRDIKPSNVIVCRRGGQDDVVKLLDFGLVTLQVQRSEADLPAQASVAGTPAFMAPEQAAGEPATPQSDVYSVGAVGYFLLNGRPPRSACDRAPLDCAYTDWTFPIDAELVKVLTRCLSGDPSLRPVSAHELELELAALEQAREIGPP